jgi:hypothetical protein
MLEESLTDRRLRAGKNVAKRRRTNGSLEEGLPLADAAPVNYDARAGDGEPVLSFDPGNTELLDEPAPRPPSAPPNEPLPRDEAPSSRRIPPMARPIGDAAVAPPEALPMTPLEMRIRRLEDALAQLQAMRGVESRITTSQAPRPVPMATAAPSHQAPTEKVWELGKRVLAAPVAAARSLGGPPGLIGSRPGWLVLESIAEARAIFRMYTDPRYRLSWTARIAPPLLTFVILISWWWVPFSSVWIVGTLLDKSIDLVLAFFLFKLLAHEARRYRETAPDLPSSLRL